MICAAPGIGKSALILTYAIKARVPTFYFSADSDWYTQLTRITSILTGWSTGDSERAINNDQVGQIERMIADTIRFSYEASPTFDDMKLSLTSFDEVYGDFPALIVVDNITNVVTAASEDDPFSGLETLMDVLHKLARDTGACVVGLHHVTGKYNDGDIPIPLSGTKGQIGRVPEMVLTLHRTRSSYGPDTLNVSTVKNRSGVSDPSGNTFVGLEFDGDTMSIKDAT